MTDLNLAYGLQEESMFDNNYNSDININNIKDTENEREKNNDINIEKKIKKKKMDIEDRPILNRQNDVNIPINLNDTIPENMYKKYQTNQIQPQTNNQMQLNQNLQNNKTNNTQEVEYENTFWNRFIGKKYEVFKLFLFSLVIVLAIGTDKVFAHYLNKYINENILTNIQELIIRIAYPILIILLLWIFKAI
tara:strand:+ start:2010 stop:2585 length:576 start_codon:yes stop_codon:yes gene_type:complete